MNNDLYIKAVDFKNILSSTYIKTGSSCPIEAIAYLNAQGISDTFIRGNVCKMVKSLQDSGVYSLIDALYPDVGTSALTNNLNLVNPLNTDGAFRRTFGGGVTFDPILGTKGDGTTGFYDTKYNTSNMTLATGGGIIVSILDEGSDGVDVEGWRSLTGLLIYSKFGGKSYFSALNGIDVGISNSTSKGVYGVVREHSNSTQITSYFKGLTANHSRTYNNPNSKIWGMARFGTSRFTNKPQGGLCIFKNTTVAQMNTIASIMNQFNIDMLRV